MDSSKASHVNSGGGSESVMEEAVTLWQDGVNGERQRDPDTRESDVDGTSVPAEINNHHRGSADKYRFNTFGYQRRTKQKVVTDFATLSKGASVGTKPRAALRQALFSQGVPEKNLASEERGQLDLLRQELGNYALPISLNWMWEEERQGTILEKNWTEIVDSHSTMSKMQRHQQEALWEFVHTELTYINKLVTIKDLVIAALVNLHRNGFLLEVTPELLFLNLPSILSAHQLFWQDVIFPMLHEVRKTGMPFNPVSLEAGCLQFHQRFSSYQHYCWEEENSLEFARRQMENNPHFVTFIQWVETHPQNQRMRLGDMQAKPHQRITKYPLLLKAVLKTTQDPHVQHKLRGMLSSVNSFLESINDYLRLKDDELALTISAQRVEGYEVEGINEEIDKHVKDICQFDLTRPIRGVEPRVVRKLLLEENLKIRGRKDNKLEVVALLFSDVLLMTKVPKKGERLRVVRPPLALDRTYCIALKDGCSFVLVEVGELQSAMNVYIFATSTSESCSTWVSTIHQAKETLKRWREIESNRKLENWKIQLLEAKPVTESKSDDMDTEEQSFHTGRNSFVDELGEEFVISRSVNRRPAYKEAEEQPPDDATSETAVSVSHSLSNNSNGKLVDRGFAGQQQSVKGCEWIEMGVGKQVIGIPAEETEKIVESTMKKEQRVDRKEGRTQSASILDIYNKRIATDPLRYKTTGPHALLLGGYPDIDYPMNEETSSQPTYQPTISSKCSRVPEGGGTLTKTDSDSQPVDEDTLRNLSHSHSGDMELPPDAWSFSKSLKSPVLRKRRQFTYLSPSTQTSTQSFKDSGPGCSASLSDSDSDYNPNTVRNVVPSEQSLNSQQVLKLGSLKLNPEIPRNLRDRVQSPQTSESLHPNFYEKVAKMKSQRSVSIPNTITEQVNDIHPHSGTLNTLSKEKDVQFPMSNSREQPSPLEGLLERAKERLRDRDGLKRNRNLKTAHLRSRYSPSSPSFSTTPSSSLSDGDRDTEWEEEVELMRHRALTVSEGWKEQLVDGDDDKRNSVIFTDGVNVDWPGWCFDDAEVLHTVEEGLLEDIDRSLAFWALQQEDGECSQV